MLQPNQIKAVELLSLGTRSLISVAREVGVSETTIHNWKKNEEFVNAVISGTRDRFRLSEPEVTARLIQKAKDGNPTAMRIYFEHLEFIDKLRAEHGDLNISFSWTIPTDAHNT